MITLNIANSVDSLIRNTKLIENQQKIESFFETSANEKLQIINQKFNFWRELLKTEPFDSSKINPNLILDSIKLVNEYLASKFQDDEDIVDITSRLSNDFFNSINSYNDQKLANLMIFFLNNFCNIVYLIENSTTENYQNIKEKVKNNLLIFPGKSRLYSEVFACMEGSINRIIDASLFLISLPLDQQIYLNIIKKKVSDLISKRFSKSSVSASSEIHAENFFHSLFTLNHQYLDPFFKLLDNEISLYDVLEIFRNFKKEIKEENAELNHEIASDANLLTKPFYFQSTKTIEIVSLTKYLEKLKKKYDIELNVYDLIYNTDDEKNFNEDGSEIFEDKLKSSKKIQELIEQKLAQKFLQFESIHEKKKDAYDFLAELVIQKDLENEDKIDLSLDEKKIKNILKLLFPKKHDLNKAEKIKAGLMVINFLSRDLNLDKIYFLALLDKVKTKMRVDKLADDLSINYFRDNIAESNSDNLGNLLCIWDEQYSKYFEYYFEDRDLFNEYLNIYMKKKYEAVAFEEEDLERYKEDYMLYCYLAILHDHKDVYHFVQKRFEKDPFELTVVLYCLRNSYGNRISKEIFESANSQKSKEALIEIIKTRNHVGDTIFNTSDFNTSETAINIEFFIDLLDFLKNCYDVTQELTSINLDSDKFENLGEIEKTKLTIYKNLIKSLITTKNHQQKNAIEGAIESNNIELFKIMLMQLDEQQITETLNDHNTLNAIVIGIDLCYKAKELKFLETFFEKIFSINQDNSNKITLLKVKNNENICIFYTACEIGHEEVVKTILSNLEHKERLKLLFETNANGLNALHVACKKNHVKVVEAILSSFGDDNDKKLEFLQVQNINGLDAFHVACYFDRVKVVEAILSSFGDDNEKKLEFFMTENVGLNFFYSVFLKGNDKAINEILSNFNGDKNILTLLINKPINSDKICVESNYRGKNILYIAIGNFFKNDDSKTEEKYQKELEIIKILLDNINEIDEKTINFFTSHNKHPKYGDLNKIIERFKESQDSLVVRPTSESVSPRAVGKSRQGLGN